MLGGGGGAGGGGGGQGPSSQKSDGPAHAPNQHTAIHISENNRGNDTPDGFHGIDRDLSLYVCSHISIQTSFEN